MASKFNIDITAKDKTAQAVQGVYRRFQSFSKPVERLESVTSRFAEGVGFLGGAAGAATAGVGILAVALGVAADKAVRFAAPIAAAGFEIGRTSKLINVGARNLQIWRGAAALNGISNEAMTESLGNLGNTLNDARWGRNNQALALLNRLGIGIPKTKDGAIDTSRAMLLLGDAMARNDPQTRQLIAGVFGVSGALALLSKGTKRVQADMEAFDASGALMTDKQIAASEGYSRRLTILGGKWQHLKNDFAENIVIPWTGPVLDWLSKAVGLMDRLVTGKEKLGDVAQNHPAAYGALMGLAPLIPGAGLLGLGGLFTSGGGTASAPDPWNGGAGRPGINWRGPRGNNPGNLRNLNGRGFQSFATPDAGIAAMGRQLTRYQDRYGLDTIAGIIGRYAPPSENNTGAYIADVGRQTGFGAAQALNLHDPRTLAALEAAMIKHEQGRNPYSIEQIIADNGGRAAGTAPTGAGAPDPFMTAQAAPAAGKVHVEVALRGAPAGTVVQAKATGDATVHAGIDHSMASLV